MKRGGPLKRTKGLKRTGIKRRPKKRKALPPDFLLNHTLFHAEARNQRLCAVCGKALPDFEAHHVVEQAYLKRNHLPRFHADNSLRVCPEPCHGQHTRRFKKIKLTMLLTRNIRYAFYLLGPYAYDYLRRHYDGWDPRLDLVLAEVEEGRA